MTKGISWDDDAFWCVTTTEADAPNFSPYYTGNGRLGMRVGALGLDWGGDQRPLLCEDGHDFWGQLNARLLTTLAKHFYDTKDQLILPAWNQLRLTIGGIEYAEENGRHRLRNTLDLRTGEATVEDAWEYQPGRTALIRVRIVVPRSRPCAAWYELSLSGLSEPATLRCGLNAAQVAESFSSTTFENGDGIVIGEYTTRREGRRFVQGLRWEAPGWAESGRENGPHHAWVSLVAKGREASFTAVQSIHGVTDTPEPEKCVRLELDALDEDSRDLAAGESRERWREIWASALHFRHARHDWERLVLTNQFHLLASLDEDGRYPLGPLGLSRPGWHGSQMWDADFWLFRAVFPLWPELARSIVRFRRSTLEAARANAEAQGFRGAFFPWLCNDQGEDITSAHYRNEIHNNAWIGLAAWEAAGTPAQSPFLAEVAWPILEGIADFFVSRATRDANGSWHLRGVLPPDESVAEGHHTESGKCDDNVLTNLGAKTVLRRAIEAADILGHEPRPEWVEVAECLVVFPPGPDGVIPEYAGYSGHMIKQADMILALYPLQLEPDEESMRRNLDYYHGKTDRGGPLMTTQIEALLTMRLGDREGGLEHLFKEYMRYVRGPHLIPFETPCNANSIMLTGIGGLLQALIFGWLGASLDRPEAIPRIGDSWDEVSHPARQVIPAGREEAVA